MDNVHRLQKCDELFAFILHMLKQNDTHQYQLDEARIGGLFINPGSKSWLRQSPWTLITHQFSP